MGFQHIVLSAAIATLAFTSSVSMAGSDKPSVNTDMAYAAAYIGSTSYHGRGDDTIGIGASAGLDISSFIKQLPEHVTLTLEGSYTLYGQETYEYDYGFAEVKEKTTFDGMAIGTRIGYDLNEKIRLFAMTGLEYLQADYTIEINGEEAGSEDIGSSTDLYYGIGARYLLDKEFGLIAQYKDVDEISFMSIGLSMNY